MLPHELDGRRGRAARVLFIQATEPAGYPPLINASMLMAEAGWDVTFLSAPIAGNRMQLARHPRIVVQSIPERPSHVMEKAAYLGYAGAAAQLALRWILMFPEVTAAIPGAKTPQQAGDNVQAAELPPLSDETMQKVCEVYDTNIRAQVQSRW